MNCNDDNSTGTLRNLLKRCIAVCEGCGEKDCEPDCECDFDLTTVTKYETTADTVIGCFEDDSTCSALCL